MGIKSLLRVGYLLLVVQGLLSVFLPKKALKLATAGWRAGFENVDELEPREWYVEVTKITGVGMLAAGLTGLLVTSAETAEKERSKAAAEATAERDSETETDESDDEGDEDDDGGPVSIDIDNE
jgi:hypothetical protein